MPECFEEPCTTILRHGGTIYCINFLLSFFFLYINLTTLGVSVEPRQLDTSDLIGCRFGGPPIAARLYLTNSAKPKKHRQKVFAIMKKHLFILCIYEKAEDATTLNTLSDYHYGNYFLNIVWKMLNCTHTHSLSFIILLKFNKCTQ